MNDMPLHLLSNVIVDTEPDLGGVGAHLLAGWLVMAPDPFEYVIFFVFSILLIRRIAMDALELLRQEEGYAA